MVCPSVLQMNVEGGRQAGSEAAGRTARRGFDSLFRPPRHHSPPALCDGQRGREPRLFSLLLLLKLILRPFRPDFVLGFIFSKVGEFLLSACCTKDTFFRVGNYLFYALYKGQRKPFLELRDRGDAARALCSFFSWQTLYIISDNGQNTQWTLLRD